ncbi:MAG: molybdopterin-dependent oxidoreductase [Burkholderiales bacterium]|nr:molybdopterin-dependent oxidoreductase [Burkholderiales bacterium]
MPKPQQQSIRTTCPRDCYDSCGMIAFVQDGAVTRVVGDRDHHRTHGALCGKCSVAYNSAWIDPSRRLLHPLRRRGSKGSNTFDVVPWDVALREIAERLGGIVAEHGGESVLQTHYTGTCTLLAGNFPSRFFHRLGATEVDPDTVCNKAGHEALRLMFGTSIVGFDPRTAADTDCLLVWGANPSASAPHLHKHWLPDMKRHARLIVVDPIRHPTAELADLHLQPRPGTDALLAFALLHVLHRDGQLDHDFIGRHVVGWAEIESTIATATPEHAAAVTGVPVGQIEQAADWYGRSRSMLWMGQGMQRQTHGGNAMRAVSLLPVGTGNIGRPGTGFLYLNTFPARGIDGDALAGTALRRGPPSLISHMDLASALENADRSRALFTWNNNIAASSPEQSRLRRALQREDLLHVAIDVFPTDTTAFADYVLPAASFLEFDDLQLSYFDYTVSAQVKAMAPMGESLPNQEIFRRLATAMEWDDAPLHEPDDALIAGLLAQTGVGMDFDQLAAAGTVFWRDEIQLPFADGRYPTPSGHIEVASAEWETCGLPRAPTARADAPPGGDRLRLLSPADPMLMNSSYGNEDKITRKLGEQTVWLHPTDAQRRGLAAGQRVALSNPTGTLALRLAVADHVPVGVALLPKGRWPSLEPEGANVNVLNPGTKSDIAESSAVHSVEVVIASA